MNPKGMVEYAAIFGGIGIGFVVSRTVVKASSRITEFLNSVLSGGGAWIEYAGKALGLALWGVVALGALTKWRKEDGLQWSILLGIGLGGVVEEIAHDVGM
jgi:hypothetical protein